jgi:small subunit ribosomal protein S6
VSFFQATPDYSASAICAAILRLEQGVKTQEYWMYFKFSQRSYGAKLPQSAAGDMVRCGRKRCFSVTRDARKKFLFSGEFFCIALDIFSYSVIIIGPVSNEKQSNPCLRLQSGGHMSIRRCKDMAKINANYEAVYILNPALSEEQIAALVAKFKGVVEANGTVSEVDEWGKRRLAYPINDLMEGYYVLMTFTAAAAIPAELDRIFRITDGVMRSIIVCKDQ